MNLFDFLGPPPVPFTPPWEAIPDSYGYVVSGQPVVCTRAELQRVCAEQSVPRQVWTPETRGLVGPEEVDFLLLVLRRRLLSRPLRMALLIGGLGGIFVAQEARETGLSLGSPAALYLAMVLSLLGIALHAAWQAAHLTPARFRRMMEEARQSGRVIRRPVVHTRWLVAMMVLGGLAQLYVMWRVGPAALVAAGNDFGVGPAAVAAEPVLAGHEWWRLLSGAFVHGGGVHFAVNMMALLVLSRDMEMYAGRGVMPLVFLCSIVGGTVLSVLLPPDVASVGNSGGLVGVIAFLGVLARRRPGQVPPGFLNSILLNVAILVGIGVIGYAYVDNAGHAGGGIVGGLLGLALIPGAEARPAWEPGRAIRLAGDVALAVLAMASVGTAWLVVTGA